RERGPWARARDGGAVDLRRLPGPEAGSHDDVFVEDLEEGWARVINPQLGLGVLLEWDVSVFGALVSWQAFGGPRAVPLAGASAVGIEPWVTAANAATAADRGSALLLRPGESIEAELSLRL